MNNYRKLEDLNLIDSFLFGAVLNNPEYGPSVSKSVLERIIGRKLNDFRITVEKTIAGDDPRLRGVRLDVFIDEEGEEDSVNTIYDVEPNA